MNKRIITIALALMLPVLGVLAQGNYRGRVATGTELRNLAGLTFYPQDSKATWYRIAPVLNATNIYLFAGLTNNILLLGDSASATTAIVWLPTPTNHQSAVFNIVATERVTVRFTNQWSAPMGVNTNAYGGPHLAGWTGGTNASYRVFTATGTNWYIQQVSP